MRPATSETSEQPSASTEDTALLREISALREEVRQLRCSLPQPWIPGRDFHKKLRRSIGDGVFYNVLFAGIVLVLLGVLVDQVLFALAHPHGWPLIAP